MKKIPHRSARLANPVRWAGVAALVLWGASCNTSNPVAPEDDGGSTTPSPPGGGSSFNVAITSDPPSLEAGTGDSSNLKVAVATAGGAAPADGTQVTLNTSLGSFGNDNAGNPVQLVQLALTAGEVRQSFFAGDQTGTANLLAQVGDTTGQLNVPILDPNDAPFFVTELIPNVGRPEGDEEVVITGTGFEEPVRVDFGGTVAQVLSTTPDRITIRTPRAPLEVPVGQTLLVDVTVTNRLDLPQPPVDILPGGFTYSNGGSATQPIVISLSPNAGPNAGGTAVTVSGDGFIEPIEVQFGFQVAGGGFQGLRAPDVSSITGTSFVVRTPAATGAGLFLQNQQVDLQVRNLTSGLSTIAVGAFRYGPQLAVTAVDPLFGPTTGGTRVRVFGQGFADGNPRLSVELGGTTQNSFGVISDGELEVTTRSITTAICADVTAPTRVSNLDTGDNTTGPPFTYQVIQPLVRSVSANTGPVAGGTPVVINGDNFDSPPLPNVLFGGRPAPISAIGPGTIRTSTPQLPAAAVLTEPCDENGDGFLGERYLPTPVDVQVTNTTTTCSSTLPTGFTYQPDDTSCRNDVAPTMPPTALFEAQVSGMQVNFLDRSTGATRWCWRFGGAVSGCSSFVLDGCIADQGISPCDCTDTNPVMTYFNPGTYTVELTVCNAAGSSTTSNAVTVPPP